MTILLGMACALIVASATVAAQGPRFKSGVDLVALNVVVTDARDQFVSGLSASDFIVLEDGVPQQISFFSATALPMDLALLLDTSASMADKMSVVHEAATGFISTVRPGDEVTVVDVKDGVKVLHPLDDDIVDAGAAIRTTTARGGTALYNGLYMTLKELVRQRRNHEELRRQAIVVLSDGDDTGSLVSFDDVMEVAKQADIAIYTIALRTGLQRLLAHDKTTAVSGEFAMRSLAQETGAKAFFPAAATELAPIYSMIADQLANQYALGYVSTNSRRDAGYRRVTVRLTQPNVRILTRPGYVAKMAPLGSN